MLNITTPPAARAYLAAILIAVCVARVPAAPSLLRKAAPAATSNASASISEYDYVPPGNYSGMTVGLGVSGVDEVYMIEVLVGTPPKKVRLQIDTGSANVWMTSEACTNCASNLTTVGPKSSTSMVSSQSNCGKVSFGYQGGGMLNAGCLVQDTISIGGMVLTNIPFLLASDVTGFEGQTFDGILGLRSVNEFSPADYTISGWQWLRRMQAAGLVKSAAFGVALGSVVDGTAKTSTFTFGGPNTAQIKGDITYLNITEDYSYQFAMDSLQIGGKALAIDAAYTSSAAIDSGATGIAVPAIVGDAIAAAYPGTVSDGSGGYYVPCNANMSLAVGLGGKSWSLRPQDLIGPPYSDANSTLTGLCDARFQTWPNNFTLLGDAFMKSVYTIFDADSMSVGFARKS